MKITLLSFLMLCNVTVMAQTFQDFLDRVTTAPESTRTAIVDSFVLAQPNSPFIEFDTLAHGYYRGSASSVRVAGDANQWNPTSAPMTKLSTTTFWYLTQAFEPDARLDYKFILNGTTWILDPRNPFTVAGGFGPNSELRMPAFVHPPEIALYPGIPHGTLRDTVFFSSNLGNSRTVRVYTPPGYGNPLDSFGVAVFHDGLEYVSLAYANNVLDYLVNEGRIAPVIAVFVPPVNRTEEYAGGLQDEFTAFIVDELMPWVDSRYRTRRDPSQRATLGASNGGNIALWIGMNHPEVFGNIGAFSSNVQPSIMDGFQNGPLRDLRLYMDLGTYDISIIINLVRAFIPILQSRGYEHQYLEFHDGHSWGNWRGHIDNALEMFFPGPAVGVNMEQTLPENLSLSQNYPNPFNPVTTISYSLPTQGHVSLHVFDVLGREVALLVNETQARGTYSVEFQGGGLASGIYLCRLEFNKAIRQQKMLLLK